MTANARDTAPPAEPSPSLREAMDAIPEEPLLPVEKKLIAGSLLLGLLLLGLLLWISAAFFPVTPAGKG
jgi:hypothetical protein